MEFCGAFPLIAFSGAITRAAQAYRRQFVTKNPTQLHLHFRRSSATAIYNFLILKSDMCTGGRARQL